MILTGFVFPSHTNRQEVIQLREAHSCAFTVPEFDTMFSDYGSTESDSSPRDRVPIQAIYGPSYSRCGSNLITCTRILQSPDHHCVEDQVEGIVDDVSEVSELCPRSNMQIYPEMACRISFPNDGFCSLSMFLSCERLLCDARAETLKGGNA